jgi:hypothetical protein
MGFMAIIFKIGVYTSQETFAASITKTSQLMLFGEISTLYS